MYIAIYFILKILKNIPSSIKKFDNRPVSPTDKKPAAKAAGFVFSGVR